jgi:hypothetical protein
VTDGRVGRLLNPALHDGTLKLVDENNPGVLSFVRQSGTGKLRTLASSYGAPETASAPGIRGLRGRDAVAGERHAAPVDRVYVNAV